MPNHIKHGTSSLASITKGAQNFGVSGQGDYGPSSTTGFYQGITPPNGGYTIYVDRATGGPSIHVANNDAQCIFFLKSFGSTGSTITDVLAWASNQTTLFVQSTEFVASDLSLVTSGLKLNLDASNSSSYPGTGTTWTDLSGNGNNASMTGVTYSSDYGGILSMSDRTKTIAIPNTGQFSFRGLPFSISMWINPSTWTSAATAETLIDFEDGGWGGWLLRNLDSNARLGGRQDQQLSTSLPSISSWTHVTFTSNGTNGKIYYNGSLNYTQTSLNYASNSTSPYGLFSNVDVNTTYGSANGQGFIGSFGSVQIYNIELTSSQVSQNYNVTKTRFTSIVSSGLTLNLDAGDSSSYSGTGTVWTDLSGNGYNATMNTANPTFVSNGSASYFNFSNSGKTLYSSNSSNQGFTFASSSMVPQTNGFTIEFWLYSNSTAGQQSIFLNTANGSGYRFGVNVTTIYYMIGDSSGTDELGYGTNPIPTGSWKHIVMVLDRTNVLGGGIKFYGYSNSSLAQAASTIGARPNLPLAGSYSPPYGSTPNLSVAGCCNAFNGYLNTFRIYNRPLTSSEVTQNYNATKSRFGL